jgi:hypothetical protein
MKKTMLSGNVYFVRDVTAVTALSLSIAERRYGPVCITLNGTHQWDQSIKALFSREDAFFISKGYKNLYLMLRARLPVVA